MKNLTTFHCTKKCSYDVVNISWKLLAWTWTGRYHFEKKKINQPTKKCNRSFLFRQLMIIIEISSSLITNDVFFCEWQMKRKKKHRSDVSINMTIHKLKRNWWKKEKKKIVFKFDRIHKQIELNIQDIHLFSCGHICLRWISLFPWILCSCTVWHVLFFFSFS